METLRMALVGNPNVGKSTVFNLLTGANQQVGNWAGKTVERKTGLVRRGDLTSELVDLPGTYSLTAYSQEEVITRDYIMREQPDVVIAIVDAANLERNLYLILQVMELTPRIVIGLNMLDIAAAAGIKIDVDGMSQALAVPVIPIVAAKGQGVDSLFEAAVRVARGAVDPQALAVKYPSDLEEKIRAMENLLAGTPWAERYPLRWLAMKRLERDAEIGQEWERVKAQPKLKVLPADSCCDAGDAVHYIIKAQHELPGEEFLQELAATGWDQEKFEIEFADAKYGFINSILPAFKQEEPVAGRRWTERLDAWALSSIWGYPILILVLALVFWTSFMASAPLGGLVSDGMAWLGGQIAGLMQANQLSAGWQSLVRDGIFAGVGAVLGFVPQMAIFFIFFSFLQDSGYLARAAFLGDRFMQLIGLHGKSFFSLVSSYGCNVPGIMATRTLENPKDRLLTMLLNPLIPCVPRLGVMSAVVAAFFPGSVGALVMLSLLGLGILLLMFAAVFLRRAVLQTTPSALVMELPPYHVPTLRNVLWPAWIRTASFLKRAWTFILGASIIIWILSSYPAGAPVDGTWAARLGGWLIVVGKPLGFDWRIMVAILFGFTAKETTLSTLGILYGVAADASQSIAQAMTGSMTALGAYTFLAVYMLYIPCLATVVTTYKESGSLRWTVFGVMFNLLLSFCVGWLIWHGGMWLGLA